jgi:hypothetical protein
VTVLVLWASALAPPGARGELAADAEGAAAAATPAVEEGPSELGPRQRLGLALLLAGGGLLLLRGRLGRRPGAMGGSPPGTLAR